VTPSPIGVGFIGAGAVTQAIHLPTLARLRDRFRIRHVFDVDAGVAHAVAGRVGASASTELADFLADPALEVVAVCSPDRLHAEHVVSAIDAGARLVLCEKPLATTEADARRIAEAAERAEVPVVVGAMHGAWTAVEDELGPGGTESAHLVRSSIVLPPNERFEDFATEVTGARVVPGLPSGPLDAAQSADVLRRMLLGLAIHDLPLVRRLVEDAEDLRIQHVRLLRPAGYQVLATAGTTRIELHASMGQPWRPDWRLEAIGTDTRVAIEFTPSYVHAGSGISRVTRSALTTEHGPFAANGYEAEWLAIADILAGHRSPPELDDLVDDLRFTLAIADGARERITLQHDEEAAA
jgi:predicted dehydrogenase